jgi:polar amino acid transport system substrate-binding protein
MKMTRPALALAALATAGLTLLTACTPPDQAPTTGSGSSDTNQTIELIAKDDAIASKVPDAIASKGTLVFATDATAPPNQFIDTDGKTIVGNEVDFGNQIASILGLKAEFVNVSFDSIIPGLQAKRYDLSISGFRDTKEREKLVNFVTYAKAGPQFFAKAENKDKITTLDQLCGHSFAVQSGTIQEDIANQQSKKCTDAGQAAVDVKVFKTQSDQVQAVASGQVEVGAQNAPNNVYLAQQTNGAMVGTGAPFAEGPWGMPIPKDNGLTEPVHAATQKLIDSPQYEEILAKWGVEVQGIDKSVINGAIN